MKKVINLNGKWKFAPTHDQKFTNNHNISETKIPYYALSALNRSDWEIVTVPGVWEKYAEKYSIYEGVCWFFREFEIEDLKETTNSRVVFKGVNYKADVYVNDEFIGTHESGYTEFNYDISKHLKNGKNSIAVCVDNRPIIVKWPNDWGYGVYGGIHRDVFIELYDENYLTDLKITPDYDVASNKGILKVEGFANVNEKSDVVIKLENTEKVIECENGEFSKTFEYDVTPWSPESPKLYNLEISLLNEAYKSVKIGFRNVKCKDRKLLLNNKEISVKGACYLFDSPITGLVMERETLKFDLTKMKEANVNAVRTHYPMSDDFYELCDEMGFMVWIEPNIYCSKPDNSITNTVFKQSDFVDVAVNMTKEMIDGARQFASVIIYGIGNECNTSHPEALPFFTKISNTVKETDSSRLIGYASLYGLFENIEHLVDIMGINAYYGWYGSFDVFEVHDIPPKDGEQFKLREPDVSELEKLIEIKFKELPKDTPILITEFGGDSIPKYYSAMHEYWSEEYHADVVSKTIETAKRLKTAGTFVFAFVDYPDPSKPMNGRWNGYNLKGMLTNNREYKLPYFALKEAYEKYN